MKHRRINTALIVVTMIADKLPEMITIKSDLGSTNEEHSGSSESDGDTCMGQLSSMLSTSPSTDTDVFDVAHSFTVSFT